MNKDLLKEIRQLDEELLDILIKRTLTYSDYLRNKRKKNLSISDSEFEGKLWKIWAQKTKVLGVNPKTLRTLYNHFNNLSYELSEKEEEKVFKLRSSKNQPVSIDLIGPFDIELTRFLIYISALKDIAIEIKQVVLNDSIYQLIKALNAVNGSFTWDKDLLYRKYNQPLNFNKKAIFAGEDELNLYLLIFAAIAYPGVCKFTGDSPLKSMDLRHLFPLLPQLGARIAPLIPGSYGLPIRIESTGTISDTLSISKDIPDSAVCALLSSLIAYNLEEISISTPMRNLSRIIIDRILFIFNLLEINYQIKEEEIKISPEINYNLDIPHILDPELTAYLLAMVVICGGEATIKGTYPENFIDGKLFLRIFKTIIPELNVEKSQITLKRKKRKLDSLNLDLKGASKLLPLATALGVFANKAELKGIPECERENLQYILTNLKINYKIHKDILYINSSREKTKRHKINICSPSPNWSIALSLISLMGYEIFLENPGEITKLWPKYWTYFKSIPNISNIFTNKDEKKDEFTKTRRRILVSGDKKIG